MHDLTSILATWAERFRRHPDGSRLPAHSPSCLGCGVENPSGHHLEVFQSGDGVVAEVVIDSRHMGAPGISHGGAVATIFDEVFGFLLYSTGKPVVTRHLEVDYLAPVLLDTRYTFRADADRIDGRKCFVTASATGPDGAVVARSTALFITVGLEHYTKAQPQAAADVR